MDALHPIISAFSLSLGRDGVSSKLTFMFSKKSDKICTKLHPFHRPITTVDIHGPLDIRRDTRDEESSTLVCLAVPAK